MYKALLLAILTVAGTTRAALPPAKERIVVMVSLDGLAGFYFDDPKAVMPTLRQLAREGAFSSTMRAVAPTVTWPNHTTLVTGDFPARHGVLGNNYLDRATGQPVTLIGDPLFDKAQIVHVPTIYDRAKAAGLTTAAIRWPASRNASTLDWTTPDCGEPALIKRYTTPAFLAEIVKAKIWPPATQPATRPATTASEATVDAAQRTAEPIIEPTPVLSPSDDAATQAFLLLLKVHRPNLALLHLTAVDHEQHLFGPRSAEAYAAIASLDADVARVRDALVAEFPGNATLVVVSDHGFSPINRVVLPNVLLRNAGLLDVKGLRVVNGPVRVVIQGGCAMVYVTDASRRDEVLAKAKAALSDVEGIASTVGVESFAHYGLADPRLDPHAPDLVAFAREGYAFGDTAAGSLTFNEKPERKGTHGHDPDLPNLHATFVAWGCGIRPGVALGEFQNTDVAPTLARLLDVEMNDVDGKPLEKALQP